MKRSACFRAPTAADLAQFVAAARASRTLHVPWVSAPETPKAFRD
jgi:ribosomal-protein-alanine N-acetyltransferase